MERHGLFIAVTDTGISVIVLQIFYNKFLPYINHPIEILGDQVDQLDGKLIWTYPQNLALVVKLHRCNGTAVITDLMIGFSSLCFLQFLNRVNMEIWIFRKCEILAGLVNAAIGLPGFRRECLPATVDLDECMGFYLLINMITMENVCML